MGLFSVGLFGRPPPLALRLSATGEASVLAKGDQIVLLSMSPHSTPLHGAIDMMGLPLLFRIQADSSPMVIVKIVQVIATI